MVEYSPAVHIRGQQSIGVWGTFSSGFQVGDLTLALHTADVAMIMTHHLIRAIWSRRSNE